MCFVFHVWAFDDVITFEYPKSSNMIISRMKRAFEVKFLLASKVLSFRHEKQGLRFVFLREENKGIMTSIRLGDKRHNQNLFRSAQLVC